MRFYTHVSPFTGKKRLVIESNILLSHNKRSRGAALGWVILHKIPEPVWYPGWDEELCSDSGCKKLKSVIKHEHWHCDSQIGVVEGEPMNYKKKKVPFWSQVPNVIKWMYKYKTNKTFQDEEERLAREAEHVPMATSVPRF